MKQGKILIGGFSGAGKSYLLSKLIEKGETGDDLDSLITVDQYSSTREMIMAHGIDVFRKKESEELIEWLTQSKKKYLALGGGTLNPDNIEKLKEFDVEIVYIDKDFEDCWKDLNKHGESFHCLLDKKQSEKIYEERKKSLKGIVMKQYKNADAYLESLL